MITFLSEEQKENTIRYSKRDLLIYLIIFISGIFLLCFEIFYLISSYPEPLKLYHLPLLIISIIIFTYSPSHFISEGLFPGSTIGTFGVYRIVRLKAGNNYHYPDGWYSGPFEKDVYIVEYAEPKQFYGYTGRWWTNIGGFFESKKIAKEYIKNHKKNLQ